MAATVFGALLFALPWLYGGVEEYVRAGAAVALTAASLAIAVCSVTGPAGETRVSVLVVLLPVTALIGLAALQLAGGPVPADSSGVFNTPKSIYPAETKLALAGLISVATAALIGSTIFSRQGSFHALLALCLTAAAAVAFGGIAMRLTGDDRVVRGAAVLGEPFARFINRNNAAAFLQVGIASGLALLRSASRPDPLENEPTFLARGWRSLDRSTLVVIAVTLVALCLAGVVASRSRGGLLAAACTISAAAPFFRWKSSGGRIAVLAAPLAIAAALLFWLGLSSATVERFESMTLDKTLSTGRIPHWLDASHAVEARPVFGAGLGTYGYAFQQSSQRDYEIWFEHADNQFLELLVEAGAVGAIVLAAALALSIVGIVRGSRRPVERTLVATVVVGQAAHAVFDYGIIVPATALAAAAVWSAGLTRLFQPVRQEPSTSRGWSGPAVVVGIAVALGGALCWSVGEHRSAWAVDRHAKLARELDHPDPEKLARLEREIAGLDAALQKRPDDAVGHQILAEYLVYRYRTVATDRIRQADAALSAQEAWRLTQLPSLHRRVNALIRAGATVGVEGLRYDPMVQQSLVPAREHYLAAAGACPRLPGIWTPLASLSFLDPATDPGGKSSVETALRLFPANPELLRTAGRIAWQAGDETLAGRCWRQSFRVQPAGYWEHLTRLADETSPAEAVRLTCPQKRESLLQIAANVPADARGDLQKLIGRRLEQAVADQPEGWTKERALAAVDRLAGKPEAAESRLRALVAARPEEAVLRGDLATLLGNAGKLTEALDEATLAAVLDGRYTALRQQIESRIRNSHSHQEVTSNRGDM